MLEVDASSYATLDMYKGQLNWNDVATSPYKMDLDNVESLDLHWLSSSMELHELFIAALVNVASKVDACNNKFIKLQWHMLCKSN